MSHFFNWFFEQYKGVPVHLIIIEIVGVIFGLLSVIFSKKRNILVYPTGIISTLIFVYLLWINRLFGDMLINAYYTIMSIYGWIIWAGSSKGINATATASHSIRTIEKKETITIVHTYVTPPKGKPSHNVSRSTTGPQVVSDTTKVTWSSSLKFSKGILVEASSK